jgi:transcriptional regulator with XRE-family HTH domain
MSYNRLRGRRRICSQQNDAAQPVTRSYAAVMADRARLYAVPDRAARDIAVPDRAVPGPHREAGAREPLWREALGRRLRVLRQEQGEKLTETAGRAGISPQYLSEVERGRKEPSSEMIAALAGALRTTLIDLTEQVAEDLRRWQVVAAPRQDTMPQRVSTPQRATTPQRPTAPQACAGLLSLAA